MKIFAHAAFATALLALPSLAFAQAQPAEKPTVAGYLQQGFDIIHTDTSNGQFIFFVLRKERTVVWCSVLVQSGDTSSCRTVK
jgi:hypothetical protein